MPEGSAVGSETRGCRRLIESRGYAARKAKHDLTPFAFQRRDPGPHDILIEIQFCGVCHTDIHQVNNDWGGSRYPMVPGHEIVGRVAGAGSAVTKFRVGDRAGVGCMVDSCRVCPACKDGEEQFCRQSPVWTYNSPEKQTGGYTYGGYSNNIVVDESYGLRIPPKLDPAAAAPLLCAGITAYSPLRRWKVAPGQRVGVVGLGGIGHMAVKFARSFGAQVVQFTSSPAKRADALQLGAQEAVLSTDPSAQREQADSFDFVLDTVPAAHDVNGLLGLLKRDGHMVLVGLPIAPSPISAFSLAGARRSLAGSSIGGIAETQEMLDYCAGHGIVSDVEVIPIQQIDEAYERALKADVKYRFVIDLASLDRQESPRGKHRGWWPF